MQWVRIRLNGRGRKGPYESVWTDGIETLLRIRPVQSITYCYDETQSFGYARRAPCTRKGCARRQQSTVITGL
jgi:hypothetical protein